MLKKAVLLLKGGQVAIPLFRYGFHKIIKRKKKRGKEESISGKKPRKRKSEYSFPTAYRKDFVYRCVRQAKWLGRVMTMLAKQYF